MEDRKQIVPDFTNDNTFGKIGERRLIEILSKSPKTKKIKDVRYHKRNQKQDIDILQVTTDEKVIHYEVKTDRQGLKTRNVSYELTSHDHAGCLARSNADYVFYVYVNPDNAEEIKEQYLINLKKWRQWIGNNCYKFNVSKYKGVYGFMHYSAQEDTDGVPMNCTQLLCNIDTMVADKVAHIIKID